MRGTAVGTLVGLFVAAALLLFCSGCRTPGEFMPTHPAHLYPIDYGAQDAVAPAGQPVLNSVP